MLFQGNNSRLVKQLKDVYKRQAVDGAITKVEGLSREMSSGKLSRSMDKCAEGIATVADKALDLATDAIPVMINGFAFIVCLLYTSRCV